MTQRARTHASTKSSSSGNASADVCNSWTKTGEERANFSMPTTMP